MAKDRLHVDEAGKLRCPCGCLERHKKQTLVRVYQEDFDTLNDLSVATGLSKAKLLHIAIQLLKEKEYPHL
jgi:hypothetical protein